MASITADISYGETITIDITDHLSEIEVDLDEEQIVDLINDSCMDTIISALDSDEVLGALLEGQVVAYAMKHLSDLMRLSLAEETAENKDKDKEQQQGEAA